MAIEEPGFETLVKDGEFELRNYEEYVVAETVADGSFDSASRAGFRRVAGYIFGDNKNKEGSGEKIQMTAPVTVKPNSTGWILHFVMPKTYSLDELPIPNNENVLVKKVESHMAAVLVFSGFTTEAKIERKTKKLQNWVSNQNLKIIGPQQIARYNDPFTLPWLRRNEIIFEVTY